LIGSASKHPAGFQAEASFGIGDRRNPIRQKGTESDLRS
jgi:hypothetical protein